MAAPGDHASEAVRVARCAWALAVAGLAVTSVAFVATFLPWVQIELGLITSEASLLLGFAAPALGIVALLGCGCSTAATLMAGRAGSPVTSALGFAGFALAVGYGVALWVTGMHSVVVGIRAA